MNILETIIAHKKIEVAKAKETNPFKVLEESKYFSAPKISLKKAILKNNTAGIIAEFKRKSPSKGIINKQSLVSEVTQGYLNAGAAALSILTDYKFFGGSNKDILAAREGNSLPILRKDFTVNEYQIIEAKALGANAILLIAAVLTKAEIIQFTALAHDIGLEVLLEIHTINELDKYIPEIQLVGINNRNLKTFEVDFDNAIRLADSLPKETVKIAESGIQDYRNIHFLKSHGFDGFLIGEKFMKTKNPGLECIDFITKIKRYDHA